MIDAEFSAYIEGLPPQDRRTVEQALHGLRHALWRAPRSDAVIGDRNRIRELLDKIKQVTRIERSRRGGGQPH
jgi:hypothetical protein